jgi:hypothetical protein
MYAPDATQSRSAADATVGWFPVLTLLLGYFIKVLSDWLQHRHTLEREREARAETRRDQLSERRVEFQRQTLVDLQEAVMDVARTTGAAHHQDEMAYRKSGRWQRQLLGADLDEKLFLAMRRSSMLSVRVRDDALRDLIDKFRTQASQTIVGISRDHSNSAFMKMTELFEQVQGRIGGILRTLDGERADSDSISQSTR